ncbi:hypothetical protein QTN80_02495 [Arachnia propionica]|uniref:hypothetical protein n=1 Tax=Arachnia propionica TaxID=1750 RepID=UPI00399031C9
MIVSLEEYQSLRETACLLRSPANAQADQRHGAARQERRHPARPPRRPLRCGSAGPTKRGRTTSGGRPRTAGPSRESTL